MSITVDDLVSSLRSSHIGQEAIDLARLQRQLSEILSPSLTQQTQHECVPPVQPYNTPISRTPSSNAGWEPSQFVRSRSSSLCKSNTLHHGMPHDADIDILGLDEEEHVVEGLLEPSPCSPPVLEHNSSAQEERHVHRRLMEKHTSSAYVGSSSPFEQQSSISEASMFADTAPGPFYLAQHATRTSPATPSPYPSQLGPSP